LNAVWRLRILRWAYVVFISAASGAAIAKGLHGSGEARHDATVVLAVAIPELLAALALLVEQIEIVACGVLLLVYAAASILSLEAGDVLAPFRFVYFAATAAYIVHEHRSMRARVLRQSATV
jgi:hypothetical protein